MSLGTVESNCRVVYTEDLQEGQHIDGQLLIVNPFTQSPPASP